MFYSSCFHTFFGFRVFHLYSSLKFSDYMSWRLYVRSLYLDTRVRLIQIIHTMQIWLWIFPRYHELLRYLRLRVLLPHCFTLDHRCKYSTSILIIYTVSNFLKICLFLSEEKLSGEKPRRACNACYSTLPPKQTIKIRLYIYIFWRNI